MASTLAGNLTITGSLANIIEVESAKPETKIRRSAGMAYLAVDPFWDNVRSDPRYTDLLRRINLPQ